MIGINVSLGMKVALLFLFGACSGMSAFAQNATAVAKPNQDIEVATPQPPRAPTFDTNFLSAPLKIKEPRFTYSGFAVDFARSTNRWKMFSLRQPVDPAQDGDNLMDARSKAGPGIKLFSIGFKR